MALKVRKQTTTVQVHIYNKLLLAICHKIYHAKLLINVKPAFNTAAKSVFMTYDRTF